MRVSRVLLLVLVLALVVMSLARSRDKDVDVDRANESDDLPDKQRDYDLVRGEDAEHDGDAHHDDDHDERGTDQDDDDEPAANDDDDRGDDDVEGDDLSDDDDDDAVAEEVDDRRGRAQRAVRNRGNSRVVDDGSVNLAAHEKTHFFSAFLSSLSVIIVSEIGDKTFFIAAILAMKHARVQIFSAAIAALALMTVLSAALGKIAPLILSPTLTFWLATALFFFFGGKLLHQAYGMDAGQTSDEIGEVEEELEKVEHNEANPDLEGGRPQQTLQQQLLRVLRKWFTPIWLQCFTMTFVAEWGDRSQIATIALASAKNPYGVTLGGILGHSICTGGAVLMGKAAASRISERAVALLGGACFLICGLYSVYTGPEQPAS